MQPSMGSVGGAWDNVLDESFFGTSERKWIDRRNCRTKLEAQLALFSYIEGWYNPRGRQKRVGPPLTG